MANRYAPYHPIIYVRGFAGTQGEIDETVADPYMGFNVGSTKARQVWDGSLRRYYFESPLVRLKDEPLFANRNLDTPLDERYDDVYLNGEDLTAPHPADRYQPARSDITLPYHSIVILRYYDDASTDFGDQKPHPIEEFALALSALIIRMKKLVCGGARGHPFKQGTPLDNKVAPEDFRVHLVAHSMGGLVCRALLQNTMLGKAEDQKMAAEARAAVDKLFTYATPHNGIDLRIVRNVPAWSALGEATNFNRSRMAGFLGLPPESKDVASLGRQGTDGAFPAERVFNLVGTNPADYLVMKGLSSWAVGEASDGLVRMDNATTYGYAVDGTKVESPTAYAHRSHSGHYGIVNSEEGFQNLTRFLFGSVRVDGFLEIDDVSFPDEVQAEFDKGRTVRASYRIEIVASLRGSQWQLHRRVGRENSAILRRYDDLFPPVSGAAPGMRKPGVDNHSRLFSLFLDPAKSMRQDHSIAFAFDIRVLVPDYEVDGILWMKQHFEGSSLRRRYILVEALRDASEPSGWVMQYGFQDQTPNEALQKEPLMAHNGAWMFFIPFRSLDGVRPGIRGRLRIEMRNREQP